jgi:hypothetical protein
MQQGRVQVDADWNEQQAINQYRFMTQTSDVIGSCGTPDEGGFKITVKDGTKLLIGNGRYYVDGIMCENEKDAGYDRNAIPGNQQPDLPDPKSALVLFKENNVEFGLVYLDVWQRHITALDDPLIREKALGGPDTATRIKTVWQVKILPVSTKTSVSGELDKLEQENEELKKKLIDSIKKGEDTKEVEKLLKKNAYKIAKIYPNCLGDFEEWDEMVGRGTGTMDACLKPPGQEKKDDPCPISTSSAYRRLENQLYRVEIHQGSENNQVPTFKWSQDNGSVVTSISEIKEDMVTVHDVGKDDILGFQGEQWVELLDDTNELNGKPGQMMQIKSVPSKLEIVLRSNPNQLKSGMEKTWRLRRWDNTGYLASEGIPITGDWQDLEGDVQVKFEKGPYSPGAYRTGDYWLIPARSAENIEWPPYEPEKHDPQPPHGIIHHYCRLSLVKVENDKFTAIDCRKKFPPLTKLTSLFYLSGDGQSTMSGGDLAQPLRVGVANGERPVEGARVKFAFLDENKPGGLLTDDVQSSGKYIIVKTNPEGVAECKWKFVTDIDNNQVKATLLDAAYKPVHLPIYFNAELSMASKVAVDKKKCFSDAANVQQALEAICDRPISTCCKIAEPGSFDEFKDIKYGDVICLRGKHEDESYTLKLERLANIVIRGCSRNSTLFIKELQIINCKDVIIENLQIKGCIVSRDQTQKLTIRKNILEGNIDAEDINKLSITENIITPDLFNPDGILCKNVTDLEIKCNLIQAPQIEDITNTAAIHGIYCSESKGLKITENKIRANLKTPELTSPSGKFADYYHLKVVSSNDVEIKGNLIETLGTESWKEKYSFSWSDASDKEVEFAKGIIPVIGKVLPGMGKTEAGKDKYIPVKYIKDKFDLEWLDTIFAISRKDAIYTEDVAVKLDKTLLIKGPFIWPPYKQNHINILLNNVKNKATRADMKISTDTGTETFIVKKNAEKVFIYTGIPDANVSKVIVAGIALFGIGDGFVSLVDNHVNAANGPSLQIKLDNARHLMVHGNSFNSIFGVLDKKKFRGTVNISSQGGKVIFTDNLCETYIVPQKKQNPFEKDLTNLIEIKGCPDSIFSNNRCNSELPGDLATNLTHVYVEENASVMGNVCTETLLEKSKIFSIHASVTSVFLGNITTNEILPEIEDFKKLNRIKDR